MQKNNLTPMKILSSGIRIIDPTLATIIGRNETEILYQVRYWISKYGRRIQNEEGLWIYNSIKEWHKQFPYYGLTTLKNTLKNLKLLGILKSQRVNAKKWDQTKWYTINEDIVSELCSKHLYSLPNSSKIALDKFRPIKESDSDQCYEYIDNNSYKSSSKERVHIKNLDIKTDTKIVTQMVSIWNNVFKSSVNPIRAYTTVKNSAKLLNILQVVFNYSLEQWMEYAVRVNSSKFLMGEKQVSFRASFAWLIKPETAEKILAGEYGIGDRVPDMHNVKNNVEAQKEEITKKIGQMVSDRISEAMERNTEAERKGFEELLLKAGESDIPDRYGLHEQLKRCGISAMSIAYCSRVNKDMRCLGRVCMRHICCVNIWVQINSHYGEE